MLEQNHCIQWDSCECGKSVNGSQLAKMKEYSRHVPAMKFIGMKQLV